MAFGDEMSRLFHCIVAVRSHLYEKGYLRIRHLGHPVISVGNLTTGGTGKTPLVIALAEGFRRLGYRPVILSRGYRRRSRGVVVVSRGHGPLVDWTDAGDEPFLMANRLRDVSIVVGSDRYEAGRRAEAEHLGDLFILDDGFQHRQLARDFDLVAIDPNDWNAGERLLPTGHWREPKTALGRAHAACVRADGRRELPEFGVPTFRFTTDVMGVVRDGRLVDAGSLGSEPVVAFAGIARPERFFETLRSLGLNVASAHVFPDHHVFTPEELRNLPAGLRITTEKDAVRIGSGPYCTLQVSANILDFESLRDLIRQRIGPRMVSLRS